MSSDDDWGLGDFDGDSSESPSEGAKEPKSLDDQFSQLCDSFDYDPSEFKKPPQAPGKMTRFEEDAINTGFENMPSNKINQMGLGPKILEYKRRGFSLNQIAEKLDQTPGSIRQWWETFQSLAPKQKQVFAKVMNENSVFNVTARMEESFKELHEMAASVKENPELWILYSGQVINYLKFAKDLIQTLKLDERREQEMDIVLEEIRKLDPKTAMAIVRRIQELRSSKSMFG